MFVIWRIGRHELLTHGGQVKRVQVWAAKGGAGGFGDWHLNTAVDPACKDSRRPEVPCAVDCAAIDSALDRLVDFNKRRIIAQNAGCRIVVMPPEDASTAFRRVWSEEHCLSGTRVLRSFCP